MRGPIAKRLGTTAAIVLVLGVSPIIAAERPAPLDLRFARDYRPGTSDPNGRKLGGTEVMSLVAHKGMLWAALSAVSSWTAPPHQSVEPGPQIVVKRSATSPWEVDLALGVGYLRAASMISVRFTTDRRGRKLSEPMDMLVMGAGGRTRPPRLPEAWSRDDSTGRWERLVLTENAHSIEGRINVEVRVLFDHVDRVTGVHHIFAGLANGTIYRGAYDAAVPGRIAWDQEPELAGRFRRPTAAAEANGTLYLTIDPDPSRPGNGGLFRRVDGPSPAWERVYEWEWSSPDPKMPVWTGMRGLTAVRDPGAGHEVLLGAREQPGVIERIDPARSHTVTLELDVRRYFSTAWYGGQRYRGVTLIAYNDMTPATHPRTGAPILLIGLWVQHPVLHGGRAWYLVRHREGLYTHGYVYDPADPKDGAPVGLRSVRTIIASPFAEERGRVLYFGGFDAWGGPHHDTAWIYRATLPAN